jgi:hypothetical protein
MGRILIELSVIFLALMVGNTNILSQNSDDSLYILKPKSWSKLELIKEEFPFPEHALIGCLCDPVIQNELGLFIIGSSSSPNLGFGLDFRPLFIRKFLINLSYSNVFDKDYILNTGLETKQLFRLTPIDFSFEYNNIKLEQKNLLEYRKAICGMIYRKGWLSVGISIGQNNYADKKNVGGELSFTYSLHKETKECSNLSMQIANIYSSFGYWNKVINCMMKFDYIMNFSNSVGIGYEKVYEFNNLFITYRHLFCF